MPQGRALSRVHGPRRTYEWNAERSPDARGPANDRGEGRIQWLATILIALSLHHPAHARTLQSATTSTAAEVHSLRRGIQWERRRTWHWQNVAHVSHSPTIRGAGRYHSPGYLRWIEGRWNRRRLHAYKLAHRSRPTYRTLASSGGSVQSIICNVFGSACSEALAVARCESGFSIHAVNGQYLGLFQMGSAERARFATIGYSTAHQQTVAAHNYYVVSGWGPWACAP